jgi:hypothetical protein
MSEKIVLRYSKVIAQMTKKYRIHNLRGFSLKSHYPKGYAFAAYPHILTDIGTGVYYFWNPSYPVDERELLIKESALVTEDQFNMILDTIDATVERLRSGLDLHMLFDMDKIECSDSGRICYAYNKASHTIILTNINVKLPSNKSMLPSYFKHGTPWGYTIGEGSVVYYDSIDQRVKEYRTGDELYEDTGEIEDIDRALDESEKYFKEYMEDNDYNAWWSNDEEVLEFGPIDTPYGD